MQALSLSPSPIDVEGQERLKAQRREQTERERAEKERQALEKVKARGRDLQAVMGTGSGQRLILWLLGQGGPKLENPPSMGELFDLVRVYAPRQWGEAQLARLEAEDAQ